MITINATVMQQFHAPDDEERSIVVLQDNEYWPWLKASEVEARDLLILAPDRFLDSEPAPR